MTVQEFHDVLSGFTAHVGANTSEQYTVASINASMMRQYATREDQLEQKSDMEIIKEWFVNYDDFGMEAV